MFFNFKVYNITKNITKGEGVIMKISNRIKNLRKELGLTQVELANKLKMNVVQIVRYERGSSVPSVKVLAKIASFFEVSTDYIIFGEDKDLSKKTRIPDREFLDLLRRINRLKKGQRDRLKWTITALLDKELKE